MFLDALCNKNIENATVSVFESLSPRIRPGGAAHRLQRGRHRQRYVAHQLTLLFIFLSKLQSIE
jgi:hypothetical protein